MIPRIYASMSLSERAQQVCRDQVVLLRHEIREMERGETQVLRLRDGEFSDATAQAIKSHTARAAEFEALLAALEGDTDPMDDRWGLSP